MSRPPTPPRPVPARGATALALLAAVTAGAAPGPPPATGRADEVPRRYLLRLRDRGVAGAARSVTGKDWNQLGRSARVDLRRKIAAGVARRVLGSRARVAEHLWVSLAVGVDVTPAKAAQLARLPDVVEVIEDRWFRCLPTPASPGPRPGPAAPRSRPAWGVVATGAAAAAQRFGVDGRGVTVGHIDTGADLSSPRLRARVTSFRDFVTGRERAYDDNGHGTHTLGIIAGGDPGSSVAPGARVLVARALDAKGGGGLTGLIRAMQWMLDPDGDPATDDQPFAVNCSWGVPRAELAAAGVSDRIFWDAVQALRDAGVVPVFAIGNDGADRAVVPGSYPHAFAVGAHDRRGLIPRFSGGGRPRWDGVETLRPDLVAPGKDVVSTFLGGRRRRMQGTSQAAPHITGILALMKQANPALDAAEAEAILRRTARDAGPAGPDPRSGAGRVDAAAAVAAARAQAGSPPAEAVPPRPPVAKLDPAPPRPKSAPPADSARPTPRREPIRKAVAGVVTGIALAFGLGLLLFR